MPEFKTSQFANFEHENAPDLSVGILIGIDFCHVFLTGEIIRSNKCPVATSTKVVWLLSGRLCLGPSSMHCLETHLHVFRSVVERVNEGSNLRQELQKFWEIEKVGPTEVCVTRKFVD